MQGFNKYYPPDYDGEKHKSLNSYRGKHALGDRARKIDQGILITRFELPFNIWCGSCEAHIGMGVRYNAEKKKVGMYYSTPIFNFRCKCHLCSNWFEIQTDPQNTRYVVVSGARRKEEDWDPEENGGYGVHDTEAKTVEEDPLVALEKSTGAQTHADKVQAPRIEQLLDESDRLNSDPYAHSARVRKRFREEKKVERAAQAADDAVKARLGLGSDLKLLRDDAETTAEAKDAWVAAKREHVVDARDLKRRRLGTAKANSTKASSSGSTVAALKARVLSNTA
ncbi:DUF572-domain-containing protein, partial [Peniophora sp. CONT]